MAKQRQQQMLITRVDIWNNQTDFIVRIDIEIAFFLFNKFNISI